MNNRRFKQIPNFLTSFRLLIIPLLILAFYIPGMLSNVITAFLFGVAAITDYFDGYFARIEYCKPIDPENDWECFQCGTSNFGKREVHKCMY